MPGYEPKLAVVIVKKRGNARFFQQEGRNIQNPQPGTIIDHTVTSVGFRKKNIKVNLYIYVCCFYFIG